MLWQNKLDCFSRQIEYLKGASLVIIRSLIFKFKISTKIVSGTNALAYFARVLVTL